ncbi:hypothetical protein AAHA92_00401 [Salvia divinorum]|uniref:Secreted protein n=1 Tax=Salvia divinorum TaxID=28513 RepID=A0ABD1IM82_SALDI
MWALAVAAHLSLTRSLFFLFKSAVVGSFFHGAGPLLVPSSLPVTRCPIHDEFGVAIAASPPLLDAQSSLAGATSPSVTWETSHRRERHSAGSVQPQLGSLDFEVLKIGSRLEEGNRSLFFFVFKFKLSSSILVTN